MSPLRTPVNNLRLFDHMPVVEAVVEAWTNEGAMPAWHRAAQNQVRSAMPLLARALDRMALIDEEGESSTGRGAIQ